MVLAWAAAAIISLNNFHIHFVLRKVHIQVPSGGVETLHSMIYYTLFYFWIQILGSQVTDQVLQTFAIVTIEQFLYHSTSHLGITVCNDFTVLCRLLLVFVCYAMMCQNYLKSITCRPSLVLSCTSVPASAPLFHIMFERFKIISFSQSTFICNWSTLRYISWDWIEAAFIKLRLYWYCIELHLIWFRFCAAANL